MNCDLRECYGFSYLLSAKRYLRCLLPTPGQDPGGAAQGLGAGLQGPQGEDAPDPETTQGLGMKVLAVAVGPIGET